MTTQPYSVQALTLVQHIVTATTNQENAESKTLSLLQGVGNKDEQARQGRLVFDRKYGITFATPQRKQVVKRSYQRAFASVNKGYTLSNKFEIVERKATDKVVRGIVNNDTPEKIAQSITNEENMKLKKQLSSIQDDNAVSLKEQAKSHRAKEQEMLQKNDESFDRITELEKEVESMRKEITRLTHETFNTVQDNKDISRAILNKKITRNQLIEAVS